MDWIAVCAEANFPTSETLETTQGGIIARLPCPVNTLRSLAGVDIASSFHPVPTVFFVPAVDTRSADEAVKSRPDRFRGGNGFNQDPHLDHVTGFTVIGGVIEAGGNDHAVRVLVEKETVHREPPFK
jgi:hypothetical protein